MATSGTFNFSLDIDEVIQEAMEMLGGEQVLGHEPESARRSINLLLQDWQNRGVMLWTINTTVVDLSISVSSFALSPDTIDVLEAVHNRDDTDIQLQRITMQEYLTIPRKSQKGRTTQYAVRREREQSVIHLWPVPETDTDKMKLEVFKYFEDVNKSAGQNADISRRFLSPLTTGLAYYMSLKRPNVEPSRIQLLKGEYEERLAFAMEEDRQRTDLYIKPRIRVY